MYSTRSAISGYGAMRDTTGSPREREAEVFVRSIIALKKASEVRKTDPAFFHKTLTDNRKLWIHLAAEAATAANPMTRQLKADIISLSQFVMDHSTLVLTRDAPLEPLLDVNIQIHRGLSGQFPISSSAHA